MEGLGGEMLSRILLYCAALGALGISGTWALGISGTRENSEDPSLKRFPILMPHVKPQFPETYLCTSIRIDPSETYYITAFSPNASMDVAHHMLLYGCGEPGSDAETYHCGGMAVQRSGIESVPVCKKNMQVIYGWAKNAPKLVLPEGVGFKIGGKTDIHFLVLQVHYASVDTFRDGATDDSGVFVYFTKKHQPKSAGVLLLATAGQIMPGAEENMEAACTIKENKVIHPFAFRVHTHALGRVVSGYKIVHDRDSMTWELIGKKNPQLPQMFYPVAQQMTLTQGDTVAARCTMKNYRSTITRVGPTNEDEMCNFYLMYWVDGDQLEQKVCSSMGPPLYYWNLWPTYLKNIPDEDASSLR